MRDTVSTLAHVDFTWAHIGIIAASTSALIAAFYSIARAVRSLRVIGAELVSAAVDASYTGKLVAYHLGPNGTTRPMHERLELLEAAHNIEDEATSGHAG